MPQRTCVGCREVAAKRTLIRIVRSPEGIVIDPTGRVAGRGAYLHPRRSCWERGIKGSLNKALRIELSEESVANIREYLETLPEDAINSEEKKQDTAT